MKVIRSLSGITMLTGYNNLDLDFKVRNQTCLSKILTQRKRLSNVKSIRIVWQEFSCLQVTDEPRFQGYTKVTVELV